MLSVTPFKVPPLLPPKDDLLERLAPLAQKLRDGDIVAISSKVVSIHEGKCVPAGAGEKDTLALQDAEYYLPRPKKGMLRPLFTLTRGALISVAGIDESNGNGYFVLYPKDPMKSAKRLLSHLKKISGHSRLGVVVTDSHSTPLRRGAMGFALAWAGFSPLRDYRGTPDIFGRKMNIEVANIADAIAAAAVLSMGEGNEAMPIALVRGIDASVFSVRVKDSFIVPPKEDLFAQFFAGAKWKKGKGS